jgi:hypothetical protein
MTPSAYSIRTIVLGLCASLVLHALGVLLLRGTTVLPDVGLELALPNEMQFGVIDGSSQPSEPTAPASAPSPAVAPAVADVPTPAPEHTPRPIKRATERTTPRSAQPEPEAARAPPAGALTSFAPKGAQLALRLDLDRVRGTALSTDTAALLAILPDVRLLLEGSGVNPLRDLSRLFLASPDLQRSHVVMAGRYLGDESVPRSAVDKLARMRGLSATWRQLRGIPVAPWHNADATARVLALIGPHLFAITREEDVNRILSVARVMARRKHPAGVSDANAAQALVSMADNELLGVSIENARSFVRGPHAEQAPDRFAMSVRQSDPDSIEVDSHAEFANAEQAEAARRFWNDVRERYASHALVALVGLAGVLRDTRLAVHGSQLEAHSSLPISRARLLLGFARDALDRPISGLSSARHDAGIPE